MQLFYNLEGNKRALNEWSFGSMQKNVYYNSEPHKLIKKKIDVK